MKNARLLVAAALTVLGACTGNPTGPGTSAAAAPSLNTEVPADQPSRTSASEDTGLVGPGGGR